MFIAFFFWYRHKKRQYVSFVSRSITSAPSSMENMEKLSRYNGVHLFSYEELEEATNNFDETRELGDGGFGTVYYGKLPDGREVAVKRLYENNYKRLEQFLNEVNILTRLHHQNLVLLHRHEINLSTMAINKIQSNALNELVDPSLGFESDYSARKMICAVAELAFQCLQSAKEMRPSMEKVVEILKDIQSRDYSAEKAEVIDIPSDDVALLKSGPIQP
ncbi:LEAF RUST 10 DISEASE-RESISTANCE LOCUS RECEPTOR-LIKE PROTEIN KINASE-LIKE 1.2 [Salix purpurea]|uniref:LEAF RUST 10 DISEASE-RESISTANCE LOCUS RECEPTOR-LIKE PROTEIN KINASE-LIKE 1.2 n=1 Tax=Salix purpurea TaxID=77065 RepID=A0A9Q0ZWA3_SALPP|nr:LEAF RUST 10 DISEASE-RESISTANCE LOCUS RECEPTOR-LIKE PROTEIN KINASE-LIKE 1.2 [Salix purpurea]